MPGGVTAIRQPWRMAAAYLDAAYGGQPPEGLEVVRRNADRWADVVTVARSGTQPRTSSAGRLFDALSAVLGVRDAIRYEGQAAIELEQRADPAETGSYPVSLERGNPVGADLVRAAVSDLLAGVAVPVIAGRVHHGLADAITACCTALRDATGVADVALSGGVFQNLLLLDRTVDRLRDNGFRVLTHSRVPTNDGGVSLGQAAVAAALDRVTRA
jgi:hydrogenase maturation protein HypF